MQRHARMMIFCLAGLLAGLIAGQGAATAQPAPAEPTPSVAAPEKYDSPMREQCMDELRKDKGWRANLKEELRLEVHEEEAKLIANNKQHVFMAYAALWILVVIFVVFTWRKQRLLRGEIERLQAEVKAAVKE
ncbi:MAG TPA: hypothetical protein VML75_12510 [Kofleriaceae bacterium]|nr:hypothetical protein [Kofleriaceae bacterium]